MHADAQVVAAGARDRQSQHLLEQHPVRQAGELVVVGEERDLLLGLLAFGDVEDHALDQPGLAAARRGSVVACSSTHFTVPSSCTIRYSWFSVVWCVYASDVLVPDAVDVVRMHVTAPAVRVGEPLGRA